MLNKLSEKIKEKYPSIEFNCKTKSFGDNKLYAFVLNFNTECELIENWKEISNIIAVIFQSQLKDEFAKWNTYLFYSTDFDITRELKYEIENNKFSSRKIIVEDAVDTDDIIEKYIFNKSLKDAMSIPLILPDAFIKNNTIEEVLEGKTVREKKVKTEVAISVLDDLYNALKEENNEIE